MQSHVWIAISAKLLAPTLVKQCFFDIADDTNCFGIFEMSMGKRISRSFWPGAAWKKQVDNHELAGWDSSVTIRSCVKFRDLVKAQEVSLLIVAIRSGSRPQWNESLDRSFHPVV